ncbi:unnamed protein product, partial [Polarella glacialis]
TWRGRDEIKLSDGGTRKFIRDHDSIVMRGFCPEGSSSPRIGFGLCGGQILPAGALDQEPIPQVAASPAAHGFRNFELHGYWRSSSSWRVRVALAHHGVDFTNRPVHLVRDGGEQLKIGYKESLNAMAQVPALSFTDGEGKTQTMTQSLAIIDSWTHAAAPAAVPHRWCLMPSVLEGFCAVPRHCRLQKSSTPESSLSRI